jgi:hypothetical protein
LKVRPTAKTKRDVTRDPGFYFTAPVMFIASSVEAAVAAHPPPTIAFFAAHSNALVASVGIRRTASKYSHNGFDDTLYN